MADRAFNAEPASTAIYAKREASKGRLCPVCGNGRTIAECSRFGAEVLSDADVNDEDLTSFRKEILDYVDGK